MENKCYENNLKMNNKNNFFSDEIYYLTKMMTGKD